MADLSIALIASELPAPVMWGVVAWLFMVGACIGSFMNVVIYRLPAGLSLLHPPSRCPACESPIRASDNVPIFGWLWLGGKCRQCKARISARYPAVELLEALVFVVLALIEPLDWGRNLPVAAETKLTQNELWGIYAYHLFLMCGLICAAFTEYDGHGITKRLMLPGFVIGIMAPIVWPHLRPTTTLLADPTWLAALVEGLIGVVVGVAFGYALAWASQTWRPQAASHESSPRSFAVALAWIGVFLGWQAAMGLAAVATATNLLATVVGRLVPGVSRIGIIGCVAPWTFVWIAAWRTIAEALARL